MKLLKLTKFKFSNKIKIKLTQKDPIIRTRLDKINIFEYLDMTETRQEAKPHEILLREIINFMDTSYFQEEFRFTLANQEQKFKFLLLNCCLLSSRLSMLFNEQM